MTEVVERTQPTSSEQRRVVAAFDVDGTLTRRDCVAPFLRRVGGYRSIAVALLRRPVATVAGAARRDRDRLKEVVVGGVMRGRQVDVVAAEGLAFAVDVEATFLRADTVARLRWHQQMGHHTVFVSASLRPYLDPLARSLGVEHVLCTDVVSEHGTYTSVLKGPNCRGAEKAARLDALLATHGLGGAEVWAYGDSSGDRELLARADHPTWVHGATLPAVPAGLDQ